MFLPIWVFGKLEIHVGCFESVLRYEWRFGCFYQSLLTHLLDPPSRPTYRTPPPHPPTGSTYRIHLPDPPSRPTYQIHLTQALDPPTRTHGKQMVLTIKLYSCNERVPPKTEVKTYQPKSPNSFFIFCLFGGSKPKLL